VTAGVAFEDPDPIEVADLRARRAALLDQIARAAAGAGRDPAAVRLVAVSKTVPVERLRAGVAAGLTVLGENRVQEGEAKRPLVPGATWELIGPLQSNKVRRALDTYDVIQSVDSVDLAVRLARLAGQSVPGRLAAFLIDQSRIAGSPEVSLTMTQERLAEELGTVREVLVRALRMLREGGMIKSLGKNRFRIIDLAQLKRLAIPG